MISGRIAEPGFLPEPGLPRQSGFERDACLPQPLNLDLEVVALEIELRRLLTRDRAVYHVQRECGLAFWQLEARVIWALNDEPQS